MKRACAILAVGVLFGATLTTTAQDTEEYQREQLELAQAGEKLFQSLLTKPDELGFRAYDAGRALTERSQNLTAVTLVINESSGHLSPAGKLYLAKSLRMWIQLTQGDLDTLSKVAIKNAAEDVRKLASAGQRVGSRLLAKLRDALKVMEG